MLFKQGRKIGSADIQLRGKSFEGQIRRYIPVCQHQHITHQGRQLPMSMVLHQRAVFLYHLLKKPVQLLEAVYVFNLSGKAGRSLIQIQGMYASGLGSLLANFAIMALVPILVYDADQNLNGYRVFMAAFVMGILGFIAFQIMLRNTEIRVDVEAEEQKEAKKFNPFKAMGNFVKNRAAVGATLAAMGMFLGMQGASAATTVLFQSYFKNVQISGIVSMFVMIPMVAFMPFIRKLSVKYGKKEISSFGALCSVVACVLMLVLPITPDGKGILIYVICQLINSLGLGVYSCVSWGLMADAIDYNEWRFGAREEGTIYSLHSFFRKLAQGMGPSLVLVIMVALGYVEADKGSQTMEVATNMRYLVAGLYLFSALMQFISTAFIYNLDKKTLANMTADLEKHHQTAEAVVETLEG